MKKTKTKISKKRAGVQIYYWAMILPVIIGVIIFSYFPMFGAIIAFEDYKVSHGFLGSEWVGLKHFRSIINTPGIMKSIKNTVILSQSKMWLGKIMAISFAIIQNEIRHKKLKKIGQTVTYLPHFISWAVLTSLVYNILGTYGMLNDILTSLGLPATKIFWDGQQFRIMLIATDIWKNFGYSSIIFVAAITGVDPALHEAAAIDGATWGQRIRYITLPALVPIILVSIALDFTSILSGGFDQIFNLYNELVYDTADVLDTYVYRIGLEGRKYSLGSAIGLVKSVIGLVLMVGCNEFAKKFANRRIF